MEKFSTKRFVFSMISGLRSVVVNIMVTENLHNH